MQTKIPVGILKFSPSKRIFSENVAGFEYRSREERRMSFSHLIPTTPSRPWRSFTWLPPLWTPGISTRPAVSSPRCRRFEDDYHSTLKALQSRGRFPRKSLGQHYMLNAAVNEQLVKEAKVKDGDVVLEIGPGTGSLTTALVNAGAIVFAVEKDPHMAAHVLDRFKDYKQVKVVQEDFTKCHIRAHISSLLAPDVDSNPRKLAKVVSNLPFNITTDVIKQLLPMGDIFSHVVLLLQDETALRLVDASTGTSEYRPINIFVNFYSEPEYKFKVERTNFFPQPNVDAAVVKFKIKQMPDYPQVVSPKGFLSMVNCAFNGKRKMLRKSLQHLYPSNDVELALKILGLPETSRPEELMMDDFVRLYNILSTQ